MHACESQTINSSRAFACFDTQFASITSYHSSSRFSPFVMPPTSSRLACPPSFTVARRPLDGCATTRARRRHRWVRHSVTDRTKRNRRLRGRHAASAALLTALCRLTLIQRKRRGAPMLRQSVFHISNQYFLHPTFSSLSSIFQLLCKCFGISYRTSPLCVCVCG